MASTFKIPHKTMETINYKYETWVDERTGLLCKFSCGRPPNGYKMAAVGVTSEHPWFNNLDCPLPDVKVYGAIFYPIECQGLWWFYKFLPKGSSPEDAKRQCEEIAAILEIEGTELVQQIRSLPDLPQPSLNLGHNLVKREGEPDDGDDDLISEFDKIINWMKIGKEIELKKATLLKQLSNEEQ